jgi:hypothetical protein
MEFNMIKRTLYTFFMMIAFWRILVCSTTPIEGDLPGATDEAISSSFTLVHMSESPADGRAPTAEPTKTAIAVPPIDLKTVHTGFTSSSDALPSRQDSGAEEGVDSDASSTKSVHFKQVESHETTPGMGPQAPNTSPTEQKLDATHSGSDDSDHEKVHPTSEGESKGDLDPNLINKKTDEGSFTKDPLHIDKNTTDSTSRKWVTYRPEPLIYRPSDSADEFLSYEKNSDSPTRHSDSENEFDDNKSLMGSMIEELKIVEWMSNPMVILFSAVILIKFIDSILVYMTV